jgi:hypothetical protein
MSVIPARHRPEEFSLHVSYHPHVNSRDGDVLPGLYLTSAGFANEGEAHYLAEDKRLDAATVEAVLARLLGETGRCLAIDLNRHAESATEARVARLRAQTVRLQAQLVEAEKALAEATK